MSSTSASPSIKQSVSVAAELSTPSCSLTTYTVPVATSLLHVSGVMSPSTSTPSQQSLTTMTPVTFSGDQPLPVSKFDVVQCMPVGMVEVTVQDTGHLSFNPQTQERLTNFIAPSSSPSSYPSAITQNCIIVSQDFLDQGEKGGVVFLQEQGGIAAPPGTGQVHRAQTTRNYDVSSVESLLALQAGGRYQPGAETSGSPCVKSEAPQVQAASSALVVEDVHHVDPAPQQQQQQQGLQHHQLLQQQHENHQQEHTLTFTSSQQLSPDSVAGGNSVGNENKSEPANITSASDTAYKAPRKLISLITGKLVTDFGTTVQPGSANKTMKVGVIKYNDEGSEAVNISIERDGTELQSIEERSSQTTLICSTPSKIGGEQTGGDEIWVKCETCGQGIRESEGHTHQCGPATMPYPTCQVCSKTFVNAASLKSHILQQHTRPSHQCSVCKKVFVQISDALHHEMHCRSSTEDVNSTLQGGKVIVGAKLTCTVSRKQSADEKQYRAHAEKRVTQKRKNHQCKICSESFSSKTALNHHQVTQHASDKTTMEKPFICEKCGARFQTQALLNSHLARHEGARVKCSVCAKMLMNKRNLEKHMITHTDKKPFTCATCGSCFTLMTSLQVHQRIHTGAKPYQCGVCKKTFSHNSTLHKHMRLHTGEKPYMCDICDRSFRQSSNMLSHRRLHIKAGLKSEEPKVPSQVGSATASHENITAPATIISDENRQQVEPPILENLECQNNSETNIVTAPEIELSDENQVDENEAEEEEDTVGDEIETVLKEVVVDCYPDRIQNSSKGDKTPKKAENKNKKMQSNKLSYTFNSQTSQFLCTKCGQEFDGKRSLSSHLIDSHGEGVKIKCKECGKGFKKDPDYKRHLLIHTGTKPFSCHLCNSKFRLKHQLVRHMETHLSKQDRPFSCTVCNKKFTSSTHLVRHSRIHTGEKPYQCDTCKMRFRDLGNLRCHQRTHREGKQEIRFTCEFCAKNFLFKVDLVRHRRIHTGERPFQCKHCDKAFNLKSSLVKHMRTHTGEKPYQCDVCGRSFADSSNMRAHRQSHTQRKSYPCSRCGKTFTRAIKLNEHLLGKCGGHVAVNPTVQYIVQAAPEATTLVLIQQ